MTLSAGNLLAEDPGLASVGWIAIAAGLAAAAGTVAWRSFARTRLPRYPAREPQPPVAEPLAERVYVIVVDGCNRGRLWQAHAPVMDRLAREGTEYLGVEPAHPARTVVCFSSMLTGASPAEHGMRSNFAPRLGVRRESVFDVLERHGRRGRLVGIAHLLDPFGEEVVRSVTSVQPTGRIDRSLCAEGRRVVEEEDPDLLVLQLLAADQLGHVRGVRNPEYLDQLAETDRHVGDFLSFLEERGKLDGRHRDPDGRPRAGAGDRRPWPPGLGRAPRAVRGLGRRAPAPARSAASRARSASWRPPSPHSWAWRPPRRRGAGRWCPSSTPASSRAPRPAARSPWWWPATRSPPWAACWPGCRREACGMPVDVLLVDDGSRDSTAAIAREHGARVLSHPASEGLGAALRTGLAHARDEGYAAAVYLDGDGEYDPADFATRARAGGARARRLRDRLALPRGPRRDDLAPHARQPHHELAGGPARGHGVQRRPVGLPRLLRAGARLGPHTPRLQLRPGAHAVALGGSHRARGGAGLLPPAHQRPLVRALPGVLGARGAGRLARVAVLAPARGGTPARRSRRRP